MWTQQKQLADEMLSSRASPAITHRAVVGLRQKKRVWERAKDKQMKRKQYILLSEDDFEHFF